MEGKKKLKILVLFWKPLRTSLIASNTTKLSVYMQLEYGTRSKVIDIDQLG